jgi:hypothetical protein
MVRLVVNVIGVDPTTRREVSLAKIESDRFDPDHLDSQVGVALDAACATVKGANLGSLRAWQPEVSTVLTADEEEVRPSLHLTIRTLQRFVEAGASFDFDPYV